MGLAGRRDCAPRELAAGTKRLDRWAPETARLLSSAGIASLEGRACLEFGSGHLLTEPLLYHLLGASRVVATDYFPILDETLIGGVCDGVDEEALVAALAPFAPEADIRRRWRALRGRTDWSLAGLAEIGIAYLAPYDAAAGPLEAGAFDLVASCSVLEHVPVEAAGAILAGLAACLRQPIPDLTRETLSPRGRGRVDAQRRPGEGGGTSPERARPPLPVGFADSTSPPRGEDFAPGVMVHAIHLEDHRDFAGAPFAFLAADTDWRPAHADRRGNRLRASQWRDLFDVVPGLDVIADEREVRDAALPALDPSFAAFPLDDLRTKRQVLAARRVA